MRKRIPFSWALVLLHINALPAAAQAKVEAVIPVGARIMLTRLGADRPELAVIGMELQPGDLLATPLERAFLELSCLAAGKTTKSELESPFRVLVDVPNDSACHVSVLAGNVNVLAESPTQVTTGGVTLSSSGTQYAVEVRRTPQGVTQKVTVFDGQLRVLSPAARGREIFSGRNVAWRPGATEWSENANTVEDIDRSAAVYAAFDLDAARRKGATIEDSARAYNTLKGLHHAVLANPSDTAKRVELAKRQVQYRINDRALYNLKRVDVTSEVKLQRYQIDPAVLRSNLLPANRAYLDASMRADPAGAAVSSGAAVQGAAGRGGAAPPTVNATVLVVRRATAAIDSLQAVIRRGNASSREYFALTKNYVTLNDVQNARAAGAQALDLAARDRRLTDAEVSELKAILERIR
ncbi:MAG: hypothetical protein ACREMQ_09180 [Longimicrobiales bacterium]